MHDSPQNILLPRLKSLIIYFLMSLYFERLETNDPSYGIVWAKNLGFIKKIAK